MIELEASHVGAVSDFCRHAMTTALVREGDRRPTWVRNLVLGPELEDTLRRAAILRRKDRPVARLWGLFTDWADEPVSSCVGFELLAGSGEHRQTRYAGPSKAAFFYVRRLPDGRWCVGPQWAAGVDELRLYRRAYELGRDRFAEFVGEAPWVESPPVASRDEQMLAGARLSGQCMICSRPLADPDSVARGIGPDCLELVDQSFRLIAETKI